MVTVGWKGVEQLPFDQVLELKTSLVKRIVEKNCWDLMPTLM